MANDWKERLGMVYSTNSDFNYDTDNNSDEENIDPSQQLLYVSLDRKKRKGKSITLIEGFKGSADELKDLAKILKQKCGVGGSAKDGEILVQGEFRDKIIKILQESGYKTKQKGG